MKIEALKNERIGDFVEYCRKHRLEVDGTFLHDEDLRDFKPDDENPTYVVTGRQGEIIAATSLIIDEYNRRGKKGRFRIFHSEIEDIECYKMLMQAILKYTEGLDAEDHLEGGSMILYHRESPVGVVRGSKDEYEDAPIMNIGPLAIIPGYQGKGLGRSLLRASLRFAREKSYKRTILCVNADNERAKALYIQEGFRQVEAVACCRYDLR